MKALPNEPVPPVTRIDLPWRKFIYLKDAWKTDQKLLLEGRLPRRKCYQANGTR